MQVFRSNELDLKFKRDGYVVQRLLSLEEAETIRQECSSRLPEEIPQHENVTYIFTDEPELAWIEKVAGPVFENAMMPLMHRMRRLHPSIIVKPAGQREVPPHVHPIFTLEQTGSTVFCWCALEDMHDDNGVMQVLPGSHKLFPIMPMYGQEPYFLDAWEHVRARMKPIYLRAGEALLFDESLIHGSTPNRSGQDRLALATHSISEAHKAIALFPSDNKQYRVYDCGHDFGYQYHIRPDMIDPPSYWELLGYVDDVHRQVGMHEFLEKLESGEHIDLTFPLVSKRAQSLDPSPSASLESIQSTHFLTKFRRKLNAAIERFS